MSKITPFLWFDKNLEEKINYYKSIFPDFKQVGETQVISETPSGRIEIGEFELFGRKLNFMAAGPEFKFNPSISLSIWLNNEKELDEIWKRLSENGEILMEYQKYPFAEKYGWCNDKFGFSWQLMLTNSEPNPSVSPHLMFTHANVGKAQEAIDFYTKLFPNSEIKTCHKYGENPMGENPENISHAEFKLDNDLFFILESGADHKFDFTEAISFIINCDGQDEVDNYWNQLTSNGGEEGQCGWCKDKYGVSWQVVPKQLNEAMSDPDPEKSKFATAAMMEMKKIIIKDLYKE